MDYKYAPVILTKRGEFKAYSELFDSSKSLILPIIEFTSRDLVFKKDEQPQPKKTWKEHIDSKIELIAKHCSNSDIILDTTHLPSDMKINGVHVNKYVSQVMEGLSINAIPVYCLERSGDEFYKKSTLSVIKLKEFFCVRVYFEDIAEVDKLKETISSLFSDEKILMDNCILIIDFKYIIDENEKNKYLSAAMNLLVQSQYKEKFKSVICLATSCPINLMQIKSNSVGAIPRYEYELWDSLNSNKVLNMNFIFGDYTIFNPEYDPTGFNPLTMTSGAKIRYTSEGSIFVYKGHSLKKKKEDALRPDAPSPYKQFHKLCKEIVMNEKLFCGSSYSWGDEYISNCAEETVKSGGQEKWVTVAVNHHIEYVCDQVTS